jgi:hypothetical protein
MLQELLMPTWIRQTTGLGLVSQGSRNVKSGHEYDHLIPKADGKTVIIKEDAGVQDTVRQIKKIVKNYHYQLAELAKVLKGDSLYQTCKNIFDFCYTHINYKLDDEGTEQLHTPARIWALRKRGIDCDDYTIFISCLLTCLGIPHKLRLAEYADKGYYQHIYVIVPIGKDTYMTIDPVKDHFNDEHNTQEMPLTGKEDVNMQLQQLSGIGNTEDIDLWYMDEKGSLTIDNDYAKANVAEANALKRESELRKNITTDKPKFLSNEWWKKNWITVTALGGVSVLGLAFLISFNDTDEKGTQGVAGVGNKKHKAKKTPKYKTKLK